MNNSRHFNTLKVALVYDHLTTSFGGAELVLQTLHSIFPDAPVFTSVYDLPKNNWAADYDVKPSFLQRIPLIKKHHQLLAPFHPIAFEGFDFSDFDIILSISNGPSKGVITKPNQLHVNYLLSPTRYLTQSNEEIDEYFKSYLRGMQALAKPLVSYLKRWDFISAQRPDRIITISKLIANRLKNAYNRTADAIIYPPYKSVAENVTPLPITNFYLCLTRLASYKRVDLAIKAIKKSSNLLVIAGDGAYKSQLVSMARANVYLRDRDEDISESLIKAELHHKNIIFLGNCSEKEKHQLLASCKALLMPGEEDFGLVGLEAAAHGIPVITYYKSGIAEILKDGDQAIHTREKTVEALQHAIDQLQKATFSSVKLKKSVEEYETEWFRELFHKTIYQFWQQHSTISAGK